MRSKTRNIICQLLNMAFIGVFLVAWCNDVSGQIYIEGSAFSPFRLPYNPENAVQNPNGDTKVRLLPSFSAGFGIGIKKNKFGIMLGYQNTWMYTKECTGQCKYPRNQNINDGFDTDEPFISRNVLNRFPLELSYYSTSDKKFQMRYSFGFVVSAENSWDRGKTEHVYDASFKTINNIVLDNSIYGGFEVNKKIQKTNILLFGQGRLEYILPPNSLSPNWVGRSYSYILESNKPYLHIGLGCRYFFYK